MTVSRRFFLGTAAAAGGAAAALPRLAVGAGRGVEGGFAALDDELPLHQPERPACSAEEAGASAFAEADDAILNHGLSPEWRARFLCGLPGPR